MVIEEDGPDGAVLARTFRKVHPPPAGAVTVTYLGDGMRGGLPPPRVRLENGYYRYELEIETVSVRRLE